MPDEQEHVVRSHHEFAPEVLDRLTARPTTTKAKWRTAAAEIIARQPHRRANVDKLIEDAGVLARWLEYGWSETGE